MYITPYQKFCDIQRSIGECREVPTEDKIERFECEWFAREAKRVDNKNGTEEK